jgi:hypothetical protein
MMRALSEAEFDDDDVITRLMREGMFDESLGLRNDFSGFIPEVRRRFGQVDPVLLEADGFLEPEWMDSLLNHGIIDEANRVLFSGENLENRLDEMLDDMYSADRQAQSALRERFKTSIRQVSWGASLSEEDFERLAEVITESKDQPGLEGFRPGGNQQIAVAFSQRIGEEVDRRQLDALRTISGLSIETVDQPMETSSTKVRQGGADEALEPVTLRQTDKFQVYGFESERNSQQQAEYVSELVDYINDDRRVPDDYRVQIFRARLARLTESNGAGIEVLDHAVKTKIAEINRYLAGNSTSIYASEMNHRKAWLFKIRDVMFEQSYEKARAVEQSVQSAAGDQMMAGQKQDVGGIDLNPAWNTMSVNGFGSRLEIPVGFFEPVGGEINGLTPVIINVAPVINLPSLLGWSDPAPSERPELASRQR